MITLRTLFRVLKKDVRLFSDRRSLSEVYILSAARTPVGAFKGSLSSLNGVALATKALTAALEKSNINKEDVQELIFGCTCICGLGQGPDWQIAKLAGLPKTTTSSVVNKLCGSGLKSVMNAMQSIECKSNEVVAVVGVDSISNYPYILRRTFPKYGDLALEDLLFQDILNDPFEKIDVSKYADMSAKEEGITREDLDNYSVESYERACQAQDKGIFKKEIVPVTIEIKGEQKRIEHDENPRKFDMDRLKKAKPIFENGPNTAINSSGLADGAASLILASKRYVVQKSLTPLAKIVSYSDVAVDAKQFCMVPSVAIQKALKRVNLLPNSIDLWEINETFALTPLVAIKKLNLRKEKVNIHGGSVAIGHPFGMTGIRLLGHLSHNLEPGQRGCAAMQNAGGGGTCVIAQKVDWGQCK